MGLPGLGVLFRLVSFLVASFLLVHLLALFGVFIVVAYPLWWLLAPKQTICFYCRAAEEGNNCPLCRRKIDKKNGVYPEDFISAVLNGLVILAFSIFSVGFVAIESKLLFNIGILQPARTAGFVIPSKNEYYMNETFPIAIQLDNVNRPLNTVRADLGFDPTSLEAVEISTKDSFATVFIEKEINNNGGYVRLTGGVPNPGSPGPKVLLGTVLFRAKRAGIAEIRYLPSSLALANDGAGSNILKDLSTIKLLILPDGSPQEQKDRKVLELGSAVLGESTEKKGEARTQLFLLPENQTDTAQVLGATDIVQVQNSSLLQKIISAPVKLLRWWNELVLGFWEKILQTRL